MNSPSSTTIETSPAMPALPTRATIADGVMLTKDNPVFLSKADKYKLYLAVEQCIKTSGRKDDDVLAALGMTRQQYYGSIWFTDAEAAKFKQVMQEEEANKQEKENQSAQTKPKAKMLTEQERLDLLEKVYHTRYERNLTIDETLVLFKISRTKFNHLNRMRGVLERRVNNRNQRLRMEQQGKQNRAEARAQRLYNKEQERNRRSAERQQARTQRLADKEDARRQRLANRQSARQERTNSKQNQWVDVEALSTEERASIINTIHEEVLQGKELKKAAHDHGIHMRTYYKWVTNAETVVAIEDDPVDLMNQIKANGQDTTELRRRFIESFKPIAVRYAHNHANKVFIATGTHLDVDELISVGLYEGVATHIDTFDLSRNTNLASYFGQMMHLRMIDEVRRQDIHSRTDRNNARKGAILRKKFFRKTGREPHNDRELAEYFGMEDENEIPQKLPYQRHLEDHINNDDGNLLEVLAADEDQEKTFTLQEDLVEVILKKCTEAEAKIVRGYYLEGKTMKEIGTEMRFSESRISQMHAGTIERLKKVFSASTTDQESTPRNIAFSKIEQFMDRGSSSANLNRQMAVG